MNTEGMTPVQVKIARMERSIKILKERYGKTPENVIRITAYNKYVERLRSQNK